VTDALAGTHSILVVDWPTRDVPDSSALAGLDVVVHGGPGPEDYVAYEVVDGEVVERRVGQPPEHADVVYTYRPIDELPENLELARAVGARTIWVQSDVDDAAGRTLLEAAGLVYVDSPYIGDAARRLRASS